MMKKETLNTLILRHGDRMLRQAGWPDTVDMAPVAPETVPGWLAACGSLSGVEILTLTEQLCQPLTYGRAALLLASARRLAGTPARLHLFPVQAYPHPERLADCQVICHANNTCRHAGGVPLLRPDAGFRQRRGLAVVQRETEAP